MSHSQNSDDRGTPEKQPQTKAPTTEENAGAVSGWKDPEYSVVFRNFKHLFCNHDETRPPLQYDFAVPSTVQPNTVPINNTTTQKNNQAGESANSAGQIMNENFNTNNFPDKESSNVAYVDTESHGRRAIAFSENFKFKPTLLSIFWKIDKDDDQRLSKSELSNALSGGHFHDDEELIICLLWRHFDDIRRQKLSSTTFFDRRGISVDEIVAFEGWAKYLPQGANPAPTQTTTKSFRKPPNFIRPHGK